MPSILFVCLGNICRSPAAEGILRYKAQAEEGIRDLHVQSCGLGDWHVGQLPDERMREAAQIRGYTLSSRAQQFEDPFLDQFDLILAADSMVLNDLHRYAKTPDQKAKIHLITRFSSSYEGQDIPDPYYQGEGGFQLVLDMIEDSCEGLIEYLKTSP
jgi:protein-tyrosine phosphatase